AVEFVGAAVLRVGPGEAAADRGIVRLAMDDAAIVLVERTAALAHAGPPLAPPGLVGHIGPVRRDDGRRFLIGERGAPGTAGGIVGAGIAGERNARDGGGTGTGLGAGPGDCSGLAGIGVGHSEE